MTNAQKTILLTITGLTEIGFITEGLESSLTGYIIPEDGLTKIAEALNAAAASAAAADTENQRMAQLITENENATAQLAAANENIEALTARVTELEAENPITPTRKPDDAIETVTIGAHNDPSKPFNKLADKLAATATTTTEQE